MIKDPKYPGETAAPGHFGECRAGRGRSENRQGGAVPGQEINPRRASGPARTPITISGAVRLPTAKSGSGNGRMSSGRLKAGRKGMPIVTGAARQETSTGKSPPSTAKALPVRNRRPPQGDADLVRDKS